MLTSALKTVGLCQSSFALPVISNPSKPGNLKLASEERVTISAASNLLLVVLLRLLEWQFPT